jgi:hypothetical protein
MKCTHAIQVPEEPAVSSAIFSDAVIAAALVMAEGDVH